MAVFILHLGGGLRLYLFNLLLSLQHGKLKFFGELCYQAPSAIYLFVSKVQHPNIGCLLGVESVSEGVAILSPLVRGVNLHDHIFGLRKKVH